MTKKDAIDLARSCAQHDGRTHLVIVDYGGKEHQVIEDHPLALDKWKGCQVVFSTAIGYMSGRTIR